MDQLSSTRSSSGRTLAPRTVLFLAANPVQLQPLQLGEECRAIEDGIRAATFREQIRFCSRWAARLDDLMQALNEHSPSVLHFCGHGNGAQGLWFQSENSGALNMSADGLTRVMEAAGTSVAVVVLNACYSEVQAQALVSCVPCVIGAPSAISDKEAIVYAAAFYGALAYGKSVANAHQQGTTAVQLHRNGGQAAPSRDVGSSTSDVGSSTSDAPTFRLLTRPGTDADSIYIAGAPRPTSRCMIVIKATVSECTGDVLARITDELRELTDDLALEIKYIEEGSVRLTVTLTPEAARRLLTLKANGKLERLGGFEVSGIIQLPEAQVEAQIAVERQRVAAKYQRDRQAVRSAIEGGSPVESEVDLAELESIWVATEPALMKSARRFVGNDADARDLVQDTFETAMCGWPRLTDKSRGRVWLFRILSNVAMDRVRAQGRPSVEPDEIISESDGSEVDTYSHISDAQLRAAIEALEPDLRQVVDLWYLQGKRYREVAEALGVPIGTVGTRIRRARLRLVELVRASESQPVDLRKKAISQDSSQDIRILIVDDDATNLKLVAYLMKANGYTVDTALDAESAIEAIRHSHPDVILMDIQLPGIDGLELTRRLKANPSTRDIVIVAVTVHAMESDQTKALAAGCDDYITKPIDTRKLLEVLELHLAERRTARVSPRGAPS